MLSSTSSLAYSPADIAQLLARQALLEQAQRERDEHIARLIETQQTSQQTSQQAQQARDERIALLTEENRWLKQQLFGRSSEQRAVDEVSPDQQRLIFNEAEVLTQTTPVVAESIVIPEHDRKKRGRKALPSDLPRIEIVHDLPESEKVCAQAACGAALKVIGQESSEQLDYVPAKVRVLKHLRLKYACPCCAQGVKVASAAPQVLPKSNASPGLLAHIVTAKYVDGTPLYRQEAQFKRLGIELPRATSATWIMRLSEAVVPLINLMNEHLRTQPLIHMDETPLQVLKHDKRSDHYLWASCAGPPQQKIVLFDYDPSRGAQVPRRLLQDYAGLLLTDGYEAYEAALTGTPIVHAGCWAHVRRKFDEAMKATPNKDSHAKTALTFIGQLYGVERQLKQRRTPHEREQPHEPLSAEEVLTQRAQHSALIIEQFKSWLETYVDQVLPQSTLGKAIHYTQNQWPRLIRFLSHADLPLDNNRCENAIRPFVIGRKNWLFCDSQAGAMASARLYSLIETAKANGLEPHAYLTRLFTELPKATTLADIEALLPFKTEPQPSHLGG